MNPIKLDPTQHKVYFQNKGCDLSICGAMCCKGWDINLAAQEHKQKIYKSESFCSRDKKICLKTSEHCFNRAYRLKKKKNGSCTYLDDENRCTIYNTRPIVCRNFMCDSGYKLEPVCSLDETVDDSAQQCFFNGALPFSAIFLFNPYLELRKTLKTKNATELVFKDVTSCKEKRVSLMGLSYDKKQITYLLGYFNGKRPLQAIYENVKFSTKQDFLNLVMYLADEEVLVGVVSKS
ncbi:MAG: YkgJ family cysteine cluster protein [Candidatus Omnitrophica bacterium]|nr:YkgJ family cysteine cluster protein [Candidatus Omnitrophota bacterium]